MKRVVFFLAVMMTACAQSLLLEEETSFVSQEEYADFSDRVITLTPITTASAPQKSLSAAITPVTLPRNMEVAAWELNVRSAPDMTSNSLGVLSQREVIELLEFRTPFWYRILYKKRMGWVNGKYLQEIDYGKPITTVAETVPLKKMVVAAWELNVRSAPDNTSSSIGILYKKDVITPLEFREPYWYRVQYKNRAGWVSGKFLQAE